MSGLTVAEALERILQRAVESGLVLDGDTVEAIRARNVGKNLDWIGEASTDLRNAIRDTVARRDDGEGLG